MRIPIICYKFPPFYSGYGKQLYSVLKEIQDINPDLKFIILTAFGDDYKFGNVVVNSFNFDYEKSTKITLYKFSLRVLLWVMKNRKTVPLIHCIKAGPEAVFAKIGALIINKPFIVKIAQDELSNVELKNKNYVNKMRIKFRHKFLLHTTNFIAINTDIKKMLEQKKTGASKIWFIPNGVNTDTFNNDKEKKDSKTLSFLYVGAINKRKGVYDLLDSLKDIAVEKEIKFTFCGPILEDFDFHKKIRQINMMENISIEYLGQVKNVEQYMKNADVFILFSYSEGLPNVLLEAASSNLPIITTDIPGSRDIVKDGYNGKIVQPGNLKEIKRSIDFFVNDRNWLNIMGNNSRNFVRNKYNIKMIAENYIELYNKLSGDKR